MIRRILAFLAAWSCGLAALHAAGGVTVSGAEGAVGDCVEVAVSLSTSGSEAVAAEIHIPLPDGAVPVEGSCVKNGSRLPSHTVSADLKGNDYVVVIFSMPLRAIPDGDGEAFRFRLDLGENPGVFDLTPTVKMSDAEGKPVEASASGGTLTIRGARLALGATDIDFGRVPIRGTYTRQVTATNTGTAELEFAKFTTDVPGLEVTAGSPTLAPGANTQLTLTYKPVDRSPSIAGRFTALSNSVGRAPFVRVTSVPFSVNELHVGSAEGVSDSEATITLTMNNMEPIAGAEVTFTLPEGLEYVDGSLAASPRASMMSTAASFSSGRKLRLVMYSIGNKTVSGEDGELMTFRVKLTGKSGRYYLTPEKAILSSRQGENMVSATSRGYVSITSPSMQANGTFDIGNVPLSGTDTFDYEVYNSSSVPLTIEKVMFLDDVAVCRAQFPMTVPAYSTGKIPVTIANPQFGNFATTMNVYSNDPQNRMKAVAVKGRFYSPNELTVDKSIVDGVCELTVGLINEAEIVALQLDVVMPDGAPQLSDENLTLLARASGHSATVADVGANRYRVIIFSLNNKAFAGNSGAVFALHFAASGIEGKQVRLENIKLSNRNAVNFTTPNTEVIVDNLPVLATSITLDRSTAEALVGSEFTLTATIRPANAQQQASWATSDASVATVTADGRVTLVGPGTAIITATPTDGSGITATCAVTARLIGDANGDKTVDTADVALAADYIVGNQTDGLAIIAADINGDGQITIADAALISLLSQGADIPLPTNYLLH